MGCLNSKAGSSGTVIVSSNIISKQGQVKEWLDSDADISNNNIDGRMTPLEAQQPVSTLKKEDNESMSLSAESDDQQAQEEEIMQSVKKDQPRNILSSESARPDMFGGKNVEDWLEEAEKNIQDHIQAEASQSNDSPLAPRLAQNNSILPPLPSGFKIKEVTRAPLESNWDDGGESLNINLGGNIPNGLDMVGRSNSQNNRYDEGSARGMMPQESSASITTAAAHIGLVSFSYKATDWDPAMAATNGTDGGSKFARNLPRKDKKRKDTDAFEAYDNQYKHDSQTGRTGMNNTASNSMMFDDDYDGKQQVNQRYAPPSNKVDIQELNDFLGL